MRHRLPALALALPLAAASLTGCAANWRAIMPGGVTAADAEWSGVKTGQTVSIIGSLDPRAATVGILLQALGQDDPLGVLLPLTLPGETQPRWVLCEAKLAHECNIIPLNVKVDFAGSPIGPGLLWRPTRLKAAQP